MLPALLPLACALLAAEPSLMPAPLDEEALVIVPRAGWDPDPPPLRSVTRYREPLEKELRFIVVHHSDFPDAPGPAVIKAYHLEVSRFSDIGYHFVVAADGTIYEARPLDAVGAHAGQSREANRAVARARRGLGGTVDEARRLDPDHGAVGIVVDGFFGEAPPPAVQVRALDRLIEALREELHIPPENVLTHREVKARLVEERGLTFAGFETECPGDALHRHVVLRRALLDRGAAP